MHAHRKFVTPSYSKYLDKYTYPGLGVKVWVTPTAFSYWILLLLNLKVHYLMYTVYRTNWIAKGGGYDDHE